MFKRKVYNPLKDWKTKYDGAYAALIQGARRVGKSTIAELFAKAESRALAIDVVKFTLQRYLAFVEEGDRNREEKALAVLKNAIVDRQRREEDASELVDRLEKAKVAVRKHRHRITIVKLPYVAQEK